jgi:tetratricopeptide (TPR) repeat protein
LAEEISIELGEVPLALDQAGAFIEEVPSTLAEYLRLYRTEGVRLRKRRGEVATEHDSVTVTFSLTFARLEKKNLAAADLVRACAFLAPDAIPEETLNQPQLSELDFLEAIEEAGRFALVRRNAPNKTVDIHRQVQEVLKDEMDLSTRRLWAECVIHMLALVFPSPLEFRNWTQCERLLPHARAAARHTSDFALDSQAASHLLNDAACYLFNRAEYAEAEPLFHRALAIDKKSLGADHPDTAQSLNNLAALYHRQGHYDQAEPLYQRALEIDENSLGADHPATATALNNLAEVYRNQHHYDRAEPLYQRAIAIREKALGPDDPDTAVTLNNLALLYDSQGHYERAEPLFVRALPILERARGG